MKSPRTYPEALIERLNTPDGTIIVFERDGVRMMTFNETNWNFVESAYDPRDPFALPAPYTRYLTAPLMYMPTPQRILMIGMGGGQTTTYLHHHLPKADITAVEIDPAVAELARKYFGFEETPHYRAAVADGLEYLRSQTELYDMIILDAFSEGRIPEHLATPEFYRETAKHLTPHGAIAQNVETAHTHLEEVVAAMGEAYRHLDVYHIRGNFVVVGYNGDMLKEGALRTQARIVQQTYGLRYPPEELMPRRLKIK